MHMHRRTAAWLYEVLTLEPLAGRTAHATMEDLAPGRVILGFGAGHEQPAFWGQTHPHPMDGVREAMRSNVPRFSTRRMVKQYVTEMYCPAARATINSPT